MWTAYFIQIKTISVQGSCSGEWKTLFWFGLIICKFLTIPSKGLSVEGQQQRSHSNSSTTVTYFHKLFTILPV